MNDPNTPRDVPPAGPPGSPPGPPPGPPPGGPPPSPPSGGPPPGGPPKPGASVDVMRWFNESWAVVQPAWLEVILAFLAYHVILGIGFLALCILPGLLLFGPLTGGLFVYMARRMHGLPTKVGDIFTGMSRFVDTTILALILLLAPTVVVALLWIPFVLSIIGFGNDGSGLGGAMGCVGLLGTFLFLFAYVVVVGTVIVFAYPLVMFRRMGAIEALKTSAEVVKPQFTQFLLFLVACGILMAAANAVGSSLFLVGALILSPLAYAVVIGMQLAAYQDFFGLDRATVEQYG